MEADFSNVNDAIKNMKSLADSLSLISEGTAVEYEGRQFRELSSRDESWAGWVSSFWSAPEEKGLESEQIQSALKDLNRNFTVVKDYLRHPDVKNIEGIRRDMIEIKDKCNAILIDPEEYDEDVQVALAELLSQFNQVVELLEPTFSPEFREEFIEAHALIDELNALHEMPDVTVKTEDLPEEDWIIVDGGNKRYQSDRTKQEIQRDQKLGDLARILDEAEAPELLDELRNEEDKETVRLKLVAREKGDVVCELSQGRVDEEKGRAACAFITLAGVDQALSGKDFHTEKEVYDTMGRGIMLYGDRSGHQPVDQAVRLLNRSKSEDEQKIVAYIPDEFEEKIGLNENQLAVLPLNREDPLDFPFQHPVSEGFKDILNILREETEGHPAQKVGVVNASYEEKPTEGEVKFVYFKEGAFYLFDSHGKPYEGESKGASVLRFDSLEECHEKLSADFMKEGYDQFSFWFLKHEEPSASVDEGPSG